MMIAEEEKEKIFVSVGNFVGFFEECDSAWLVVVAEEERLVVKTVKAGRAKGKGRKSRRGRRIRRIKEWENKKKIKRMKTTTNV